MKKLISSILILSLVITLSIPVAFAENISISANDVISAVYNGHGEFKITTPRMGIGLLNNDVNNLDKGDVIVATATDDKEIYKINEDKYLSLAYDDTYLLSDKVEVCVDDYESNQNMFDRYGVSQNIRDEIKDVIDEQKALGNEDFTIDIYAPGIIQGDVQIMADEPLGYNFYTYNYYGQTFNMRDYSVKYKDVKSGKASTSGASTLSKAKAFINFAVAILSSKYETINAFSSGQSAYQALISLWGGGSVSSGSSSDEMWTVLIYSWIHKETIAQDIYGEYAGAGCSSYKAWLDHQETYQYYSSVGRSGLVEEYIGKELYSENFKNPAPVAIDWGYTGYTDYFLNTTIHGKNLILVGH